MAKAKGVWRFNDVGVVEETPVATITYNGKSIELTDGQIATLHCAGKKAVTDIVVVFDSQGRITYDGLETEVDSGKIATLSCAGKKMLTDIIILTNISDISLGLISSDGYVLVSNDDFILSPLSV